MSTTIEPELAAPPSPRRRRPAGWKLVVSAVLVLWLGAQLAAGWKFANGRTYPVVGSAMFNGPPSGAAPDFMVPRVFLVAAGGERTEIDHHTFGLEPFEWRRWIKRHLEDVDDTHARQWAIDLRTVVAATEPGSAPTAVIELWRVPALHEGLEHGHLIRRIRL